MGWPITEGWAFTKTFTYTHRQEGGQLSIDDCVYLRPGVSGRGIMAIQTHKEVTFNYLSVHIEPVYSFVAFAG